MLRTEKGESLEQIGDATNCYIGAVSTTNNEDEIGPLRIGIPEAFVIEECSPQILDAWECIINLLEGSNISTKTIPDGIISKSTVRMSLPAYYVITSAEASSNLARYDGLRYGKSIINDDEETTNENSLNLREKDIAYTRNIGFGNEVKRRILAGTAVLSSDRFHSYYEAATKVRAEMASQFNRAFHKTVVDDEDAVNLIVIPTTISHPTPLGVDYSTPDNTEAFQNDIMTTPISLAGLPSISIPVWVGDCHEPPKGHNHDACGDHPVVGIQIIGPRHSEKKLLQISEFLLSKLQNGI